MSRTDDSTIAYAVVNAFAAGDLTGNPAAVVVLERPLSPAVMQEVAASMGLSETAFAVPTAGPDRWGLRWFTPTVETALCGHATLAAASTLWEDGLVAPNVALVFDTRSGALQARRDGDRIILDFPTRLAVAGPPPTGLDRALPGARYLGVTQAADPLERNALVELDDPAALRGAAVDLGALEAVLEVGGLIVTSPSDVPGVDYLMRYFAPRAGIPEDPVTGSAHCTTGPLWSGRLGRAALSALQVSPRGGALTVTTAGDRVQLAGRAVRTVTGTLPVAP